MKAFESYHPFVTLVYFLSVLSISMFVMNPIIEITALIGAFLFCITVQKPSDTLKNTGFYLVMFLLVTLTNPLFSHSGNTVLFTLGNIPVTLEALLYGGSIALTVIAVMLWCKCYSLVFTSDKFLYLFGKAIPKLSLIISTALRFIPLFKKQFFKVTKAQKAMGIYSSDTALEKIKSTGRVFVSTISWSLENSMETSSSMKSRGYSNKNRSNFSVFKFERRDAVFSAVCVLLLLNVLFGVSQGVLEFEYYPVIAYKKITPIGILSYISFFTLSVLPFIIEVKEAILWKYYVSRI